jgi:hypothetical protein
VLAKASTPILFTVAFFVRGNVSHLFIQHPYGVLLFGYHKINRRTKFFLPDFIRLSAPSLARGICSKNGENNFGS